MLPPTPPMLLAHAASSMTFVPGPGRFSCAWPRRLSVLSLAVLLLLSGLIPRAATAQGGFKKRAMQLALCGGMAYGGYKLGEKIAQYEIKRQGLVGQQAVQMTKALQIGAALILCKGGAALAGSAYDKLSKRDLEARQREMQAALAVAEPTQRPYVMPESGRHGTLTTKAPEQEGEKECRIVVDQLADVAAGEQAITKFCRKPGGDYELEAI